MTALAVELLRILTEEAGYPPMTPESLGRVLHALGWTPEPSTAEIVATLDGLLAAGRIERVYSARLGARYRVMPSPARPESLAGGAFQVS